MRTAAGRRASRAATAVAAATGLVALASVAPHATAGPARPAAPASGAVVSEWMGTVTAAVDLAGGLTVQEEMVWHAFVATAMYNAVVGIEGRYEPYRRTERGPRTASSEAAAAAAAYRLLRVSFPAAAPRLRKVYAASLARVPDGRAEDEGVAFGERAADHILALRAGDGRGAPVAFPARPAPGVWRPTPPGHRPFADAWLGRLRPMLIGSPDRFRPPPPPRLTSVRYARDLAEVRAFGAKKGSLRTPWQTETARYFTDLDIQKALGDHADRHRFDIVDTARLYAAANTTQLDAVVTAWDAKLHYGTWRPVTAIREADRDGNPATRADPQWEPLLTTPPHPDYLSGHATSGGALMRTLTGLFGTSRVDLFIPATGTGVTRHYRHADDYNRDVVNARVWGGIHTRFADTAGNAVGQRLSAWALERYFRPVRR
ncbi:vanadium-dependent haloperoxidase [Streptomyces sp. CB03234]|uniref:vanadium-dependent haloperoxidase n=1 Tax=Streptomyces sp. (strain CB03234) TaxID=1703937 RepID=UPI001F5208A6|nr:vanadium-dependent haloperoxidase [Streptomyces sp. CB03234]